jgi:hypothetical protein
VRGVEHWGLPLCSAKQIKPHVLLWEACSFCVVYQKYTVGNMEDNQATSFEEVGVVKWLSDACRQVGIKQPTIVQRNCIPHILKGLIKSLLVNHPKHRE